MTAYVTFAGKNPLALVKVPLTALLQEKSTTSVWIVENGMVKLVPVQVAGPAGNDILLAGGVNVGQVVVTAGVNLLKPGQKVNILDDASGAESAAKVDPKTASNLNASHQAAVSSSAGSTSLNAGVVK